MYIVEAVAQLIERYVSKSKENSLLYFHRSPDPDPLSLFKFLFYNFAADVAQTNAADVKIHDLRADGLDEQRK